MKFGILPPIITAFPTRVRPWELTAPPETSGRIARKADELGYDWLMCPDNIVMPLANLASHGPRWSETLTSLAFFAGATTRIRVVPTVLALPYRAPVFTAKAIATIDFLSGGRLTLGIGSGGVESEFRALKIPWEERGAITDEYLAAMKELWTSDEPRFNGRYIQFEAIAFEPRPLQKPHPPIWVGGYGSRRSMLRAVNAGDGWVPSRLPPEELPECLAFIREQPAYQERTSPFEVVMPLLRLQHSATGYVAEPFDPKGVVERLHLLREVGVTGVSIASFGETASLDEYLERLEWFAAEIMPQFRNS